MRIIRRTKILLLALVLASVSLVAAQAQSFPNRPVHIIIGVSPGGQVDNTARALARQLSKLWGQPVIVETRLGAAGAVANEFVAKSPTDGYTLLIASDDITGITALRSDLPYDLLHDLAPVSLVATAPNVLVVRSSLPVNNVKELIDLAKSEPGKLTYESGGVGSLSHLQTARMAAAAHINLVHVPYQGTSAGVTGIVDGEVDMGFAVFVVVQGLADAGKLRIIAVSSPRRSPYAPSIPTVSESGLPGFSYDTWYGLFAPAGVPKAVLATLNTAVAKAVNTPEMKAALGKQGAEAQADSPAQFAAIVRSDLSEKIKLVKLAGLKAK